MKMEMFSVWDRKTCVMMAPVCYHNKDQAMRELAMALDGNPNAMISKFPEDFALMRVGRWDDNTGGIESFTPEFICTLACLVAKHEKPDCTVIPFGSASGSSSSSADQAPPLERGGGGR